MQENEDVLLQEIIEKWLVEKMANVKQTTFERYQCVTDVLTDYFKGKTVRQITGEEINNFISERREKGWSSSSLLMAVGIKKALQKLPEMRGIYRILNRKSAG